jgi:hypothetical protein
VQYTLAWVQPTIGWRDSNGRAAIPVKAGGRFFIAAQGGPVGVNEIIVIGVVVVVMGGMGALVYYANAPAKKDSEHEPKKTNTGQE